MSSSLGTPVSALAAAAAVASAPEPSSSGAGGDQQRVNLLDNVRAAAWFTTRLAVIKPLLAAAPAAKAISALLFQELVHLFPEHIAAEVAVAMGSFLARSAALLTDTREGDECRRSIQNAYSDAVDCCSTVQGENLTVESSEAVVRLLRALRSKEAKEFYAFCERAAQAALRVAGSDEASALVSSTRVALDSTLDLAASEQAVEALRDAVVAVTGAFRERRGEFDLINRTAAENDTLSECDSDQGGDDDAEDTIYPATTTTTRPSSIPTPQRKVAKAGGRRSKKSSSFWIDNLTGLFIITLLLCWTVFAIFGIFVAVTHRGRSEGVAEALGGGEAPRPAPPRVLYDDDELL